MYVLGLRLRTFRMAHESSDSIRYFWIVARLRLCDHGREPRLPFWALSRPPFLKPDRSARLGALLAFEYRG